MQLYGLKTCTTCRKALKELSNAEFVDVRKDGVPEDVLERAQAQFGDKLLNTRSTTWRGLSQQERDKPMVDLLKEHPALMKRPLIVKGDQLWLGWDPQVQQSLGVAGAAG